MSVKKEKEKKNEFFLSHPGYGKWDTALPSEAILRIMKCGWRGMMRSLIPSPRLRGTYHASCFLPGKKRRCNDRQIRTILRFRKNVDFQKLSAVTATKTREFLSFPRSHSPIHCGHAVSASNFISGRRRDLAAILRFRGSVARIGGLP